MSRFANLFDAGVELAFVLDSDADFAKLSRDVVFAHIMHNGVPVLLGMESAHGRLNIAPIEVMRDESGVVVSTEVDSSQFDGRTVVVVDDGVETGTAALSVARWLKSVGAAKIVLAVPVCPKTAMNQLQFAYELILTVQAPLGARSLAWHFDDFDLISVVEAQALLAQRELQSQQE